LQFATYSAATAHSAASEPGYTSSARSLGSVDSARGVPAEAKPYKFSTSRRAVPASEIEAEPRPGRGAINFLTSAGGVADRVEISLPIASIAQVSPRPGAQPRSPGAASDGAASPKRAGAPQQMKVIVTRTGGWKVVPAEAHDRNVVATALKKEASRVRLDNLRKAHGSFFSAFCCCLQSRTKLAFAPRDLGCCRGRRIAPANSSRAVDDAADSAVVTALHRVGEFFVWFAAVPTAPEIDSNDDIPEVVRLYFDLSLKNRVRRAFLYLRMWPWFDAVTTLFTIVSCLNLALDEPRLSDGLCFSSSAETCALLSSYLDVSDNVVAAWFSLELVVTIFSMGLVDIPGTSVLRSSWGILDVLILAVSYTAIVLQKASGSFVVQSLRALRALRALRVLRAIQRLPQLRLIIDAIALSFPRVKETVAVLLLVMYIFAVTGLQQFMGGAWSCSSFGPGAIGGSADSCVGSFVATGDFCAMASTDEIELQCRRSPNGMELPKVWYAHPWGFDNIGGAMLVVFELLAGENWPYLMAVGTNVVGNSLPQSVNACPQNAIFYVVIEIVLNQLLIELFSGVVIDTYLELRTNSAGLSLLTDDQKVWVENMRVMLVSRPVKLEMAPTPRNPQLTAIVASVFRVVTHPLFDNFVTALVLVNLLLISIIHYGAAQSILGSIDTSNLVFTILFDIEAVLRLVGLGHRQYFASKWNCFDFLLCVGSSVSLGVRSGVAGSLFRLVRALRCLRVLRYSAGLTRLMRALTLALPSLFNVVGVLFIVVFIFAVLAVNLFAGVRTGWFGYVFSYAGGNGGGGNGGDIDFNSFANTYMALLKAMSGENFNGIMHDLMAAPPFCVAGPGGNCSVPYITPLFWVVFYAVTSFMIINIISAVALEAYDGCLEDSQQNFSAMAQGGEDGRGGGTGGRPYRLTPLAMDQYLTAWNDRDVFGTQYLAKEDIVAVLIELNYPLGLRGDKRLLAAVQMGPGGIAKLDARQRMQARVIFKSLNLVPNAENRFHFHAVLHALMDRASGGSPLGVPTEVDVANASAVVNSEAEKYGLTVSFSRPDVTFFLFASADHQPPRPDIHALPQLSPSQMRDMMTIVKLQRRFRRNYRLRHGIVSDSPSPGGGVAPTLNRTSPSLPSSPAPTPVAVAPKALHAIGSRRQMARVQSGMQLARDARPPEEFIVEDS